MNLQKNIMMVASSAKQQINKKEDVRGAELPALTGIKADIKSAKSKFPTD